MDIQSWTTILALDLSTYDIGIMRLWLREHAAPVPSTNRGVIGKYLNAHLATNLAWDGLLLLRPVSAAQPCSLSVKALNGTSRPTVRSPMTPVATSRSRSIASRPL